MEYLTTANLIGFFIGLCAIYLSYLILNYQQKKKAEKWALELIQEAKDQAQDKMEELEQESQLFQTESLQELEIELQPRYDKLEVLKNKLSEKELDLKHRSEKLSSQYQKRKSAIDQLQTQLNSKTSQYEKLKDQKEKEKQNLVDQLIKKTTSTLVDFIDESRKKLIQQFLMDTTKKYQLRDEEWQLESEKTAKRMLYSVLNRLHQPYCPDRGINNIIFPNQDVMDRVLGPNDNHIGLLEQRIGVDLTPQRERLFLNVSGFDPVRRELTRLTVEQLMKDSRIDEKRVETIFQRCKKELLRKIKSDGNAVARELGLRDLHPNIRNMLGSLKYRYSYTQNQYFHVSEVGWVCGLLASELGGIPLKTARRSGLLHDIGKAMDHSIDGGHAVIGADFIEKNGESPEVVHAVRAHHYDETPNSDLAYLVIAADAISGARPGARRSTAESYTQKLSDLERIGNSFDGVKNTFVLSAGREVRLFVDSRKIDDQKALKLSQSVAKKIEEECAFPGQIRVTIVRQTEAIQYAK